MIREPSLLSKNPSKESLRQLLQAQCDDAMLLDTSVHKLYAAEPAPPKSPYRPKKKRPADAYELEIQRLAEAHANGTSAIPIASAAPVDTPAELDFIALEKEAAEFMRNRRSK